MYRDHQQIKTWVRKKSQRAGSIMTVKSGGWENIFLKKLFLGNIYFIKMKNLNSVIWLSVEISTQYQFAFV